ncbi:hypothetical protein GUJ93_ZPchr0119g33235, partial [Zizania palustris]
FLKPPDLRLLVPAFSGQPSRIQMDTVMPAGDVLANLLTAVATEGPLCDMPDFKMDGERMMTLLLRMPVMKKVVIDGDEDGDFGEGEEDASEGEGYDNPKGTDNNKRQRG